jgi:hypothetical protein
MKEPLSVPFSQAASLLGEAGFNPLLPIFLTINDLSIEQLGLLDTGASVNVLPYVTGLSLGLNWENQNIPLQLTGNLANFEAKAILIQAKIGDFNPVRLAFAWTKAERVPLILGQTNFFMEFDVCFFRSQLLFEVKPKSV